MSDKEKIIKGLEECAGNGNCTKCQYGKEKQTLSCKKLLADALALLKEQEPMVKPTKCPCGELFDAKDSSFCPKCGCAYGELSGRYTNI